MAVQDDISWGAFCAGLALVALTSLVAMAFVSSSPISPFYWGVLFARSLGFVAFALICGAAWVLALKLLGRVFGSQNITPRKDCLIAGLIVYAPTPFYILLTGF